MPQFRSTGATSSRRTRNLRRGENSPLTLVESAVASGPRGAGFTVIEVLVLLAIVGVLIALLLPAIQQAREAARRTACRNNLKQIGVALHSYHDVHAGFPPGYIRAHGTGWSAFLLPYLDHEGLYDSLVWGDLWNEGGPNQAACETLLPIYRCPSASLPDHEDSAGIARRVPSTYLGCASGTERHDEGTGPAGYDDPDEDGLFMENVSIRLRSVSDGTNMTVAAGETLHTAYDGRDHWYIGSPDLDQGKDASEFLGTTAVPLNTVDEEAFRSEHPGGCYFLMVDGSVKFVSETINAATLSALGTRSGREPVTSF